MIRCVRLWTGQDGNSHFRDGRLDLEPGRNNDLVSATMAAAHATVEETAGGGSLAWHTAPVRQLVVTLCGTLIFTTRDGEEFTLRSGEVLFAQDTAGTGHRWRIEGS
jgi:quercetin dioxygenase-like cupin family protein